MDLTVIAGPNFSGRTARLRSWAGLPKLPSDETVVTANAYIGPDPVNALSGLAPTVHAEFELAAHDRDALADVRRAAQQLGFSHILEQNPFTLSGGEQAITAVLAAAAGRPDRLAIDSTLEQLAPPTRIMLLAWLADREGQLMIADNRTIEWHHGPVEEHIALPDAPVLSPDTDDDVPVSPQIDIHKLSFGYPGGRRVFDGLSLQFERGKAYHLKGANGAGKSTLSKLLSGLLKPDSGEIHFDGVRVEPWRKPGRLVSYHFQNPSFQLFAQTVARQLTDARDIERTARQFGLKTQLAEHPLDLPFVLRKRLALAASVSRPSEFLILDEPTLGQDDQACRDINILLNGRGGLTISHSVQPTSSTVITI